MSGEENQGEWGLLCRNKERAESGEGSRVDDDLGLNVVASDDVAHGAQGGGDNAEGLVRQQLHEAAVHTSLDDLLDALVGAR